MTAGAIARLNGYLSRPAIAPSELPAIVADLRALLASHAVLLEALERIQDQRPPNGWSAGNIARKALADANEGS